MPAKTMPYKPVLRVGFGDRTFDLVKVMASEVSKVQLWTGLGSKKDWIDSLGEQNIEAFKAAYALMCQRAGEDVRFSDVDFDTDDLSLAWIDVATGRDVEPLCERDDNGDLKVDKDGDPVPVKDNGDLVWVFSDTEERVPLPPTDPTT